MKTEKSTRFRLPALLLAVCMLIGAMYGCSAPEPAESKAPSVEPSALPAEATVHEARVQAPTGTYEGSMDNGVEAYLGVRYAAPIEPFKAPKDVTTSTGDVIEAKAFGPSCLQAVDPTMEPSLGELSSDCLTLNIWTKDHSTSGKPVMLFIHGGSFVSGGSNDSSMFGDNFIRNLADGEDAVMITANHRLGLLGQIDMSLLEGYTDEYADCNSLWILDVIQALKWVNENIEAFGGDPKNVTIFGQSSGGMLCYYLSTVPEARQYFQKVIVESGAPFYGLTSKESYQANCRSAFEELGVTTVEELISLTDEEIQDKIALVTYVSSDLAPRYIDGRVVPLTWWDDFMDGCAKDIKFMIGSTNGEVDFSIIDSENYPNFIDKDSIFTKLYNRYAAFGKPNYAVDPNGCRDVIDSLMATEADDPDTRAAIIFNYFCHDIGNSLICEAQSKYNDTYFYRFDWTPDASAITSGLENAAFSPLGRSPHCAELPVVFDTCEDGYTYLAKWWLGKLGEYVTDKYDMSENPDELIAQTQAAWYSFAKTGDPNNSLIPEWSPYTSENRNVMKINSTWEETDNLYGSDTQLLLSIRPYGEKAD